MYWLEWPLGKGKFVESDEHPEWHGRKIQYLESKLTREGHEEPTALVVINKNSTKAQEMFVGKQMSECIGSFEKKKFIFE